MCASLLRSLARQKQPFTVSLGPEGVASSREEAGQAWGKFSPKLQLHGNIPKFTNIQSVDWMLPFPLNFEGLEYPAV